MERLDHQRQRRSRQRRHPQRTLSRRPGVRPPDLLKERSTGTRNARKGDPASIIRQEVPALRIVSEDLWFRVRARYEENRLGPPKTSSLASVRPKHLLSGKMTCGHCNGSMVMSGSGQRFVCSPHREKGNAVCTNGRSAKAADIADQVLAALRDRLLAPDIVASAIEERVWKWRNAIGSFEAGAASWRLTWPKPYAGPNG